MKITFYREWLPLDKPQFAILSMLADKGKFTGNLNDICRYFSESRQNSNRRKHQLAIEALCDNGFVSVQRSGRTWTLEVIPKEDEIQIEQDWFQAIRLRPPASPAVSWIAVLKVLLWACGHAYDEIITNAQISEAVKFSPSTICDAKNVLEKEFGALIREKVSKKDADGSYFTIGQHLGISAFWNAKTK